MLLLLAYQIFLPAENIYRMKNVSNLISQTGWWGVWAVASCTCYPPEVSVHPQTQIFELEKKNQFGQVRWEFVKHCIKPTSVIQQ